ncbi:hypothetical protein L1987_71355 [Smallanthus sonchifolius]|uniref:Uncharacterized protein n=1 Tax=Smallanthus sonchifolius TaxID=185202 RepID=A0ACB9AS74_9ASTR|nr:hypothetical protein L1987_71355 [Smallanthus sonchifolius]
MERSLALPPNRSISLPSRLHPTSLRVEAELNKLREWEIRSCSSSETLTADIIHTGLFGLSEVYRCMEELVYSSFTQHRALLEQALDHSLKLLDACGIIKDTQQKMKEQALCLQSSLRRRGKREISSYLGLRKKLKKDASNCIRSLKRSERKFEILPSSKDYHSEMVVKIFRDLNLMTSRVLQSLLVFLSSPRSMIKNTSGGCSFVSRLWPTEKIKNIMSEVDSVDDALFCVLHGMEDMTMAHRKLEHLVINFGSIEAGLDVVFRRLIRYRVSILNVITR